MENSETGFRQPFEPAGVGVGRRGEQPAGQSAEAAVGQVAGASHLACFPALAAAQVGRLEGLGADPRTGRGHKVAAPHTVYLSPARPGLHGVEGLHIPV